MGCSLLTHFPSAHKWGHHELKDRRQLKYGLYRNLLSTEVFTSYISNSALLLINKTTNKNKNKYYAFIHMVQPISFMSISPPRLKDPILWRFNSSMPDPPDPDHRYVANPNRQDRSPMKTPRIYIPNTNPDNWTVYSSGTP